METTALRTLVGTACAYEIFALTTRKLPTLSHMCRHHRMFEAALLAALITHFHLKEKELYVL